MVFPVIGYVSVCVSALLNTLQDRNILLRPNSSRNEKFAEQMFTRYAQ